MIESTAGKESLALKDAPEALDNRGSERILDENTRMQNELMGLKGETSRESNESEEVPSITPEDIDLLTRRNSLN